MGDRAAIVLPGGGYSPTGPLLAYAAEAAEARGATVHRVAWSGLDELRRLVDADAGPPVLAQVVPVVEAVVAASPGTVPVLVAKSLGSHAAGLAADRRLPAIWLTPLLSNEWVVAALQRADAPALLVGGTADPYWDGAAARRLSPHVLEVADADHGMYVPGRLAASAAVLGRVATAVEDFLDDVVWR